MMTKHKNTQDYSIAAPFALYSPNEMLLSILREKMSLNKQKGYTTLFALIELESFRRLEKSYPAKVIDQGIKTLKNRIQTEMGEGSFLQNIGGGRIALICSSDKRLTTQDYHRLFVSLQSVISQKFSLGDTQISLTSSIGFASVCMVKDLHKDISLIDAATFALIEALHKSSSVVAFTSELTDQSIKKLKIFNDLVPALQAGEFVAVFQPQINSQTNEILGFEALARWNSKQQGAISPAQFLPYFEDAGIMSHLGSVILRHALSALKEWDKQELNVATVSVNMSMSELQNPRLSDIVAFELERLSLDPSRLIIEVLENVVTDGNPCTIIDNIKSLQKMGCAIDLDDFGTGQASITAIRRFCVDRIKIDRSFISNIHQNLEQQDMVIAILSVAKRLNVDILAEGVEQEDELDFLNTAGCPLAQGYFISRPLQQDDVPAWIAEHKKMSMSNSKVKHEAITSN